MNARPPAPIRPTDRRRQRGMTLLELLVVVALMSAVGFMALSQVGDDLGQARYQDTENRLIALRRAIIGYEEPVFNGQRLFSGYAADNGRLPFEDWGLRTLIVIDTADGSLDEYGAKLPIFDPTPDSEGFDTATGDELDATGAKLFKGWRGPYLFGSPGEKDRSGENRAYRDGWGNEGLDVSSQKAALEELNFGWRAYLATTVNDQNLELISLGRDGKLDSEIFPDLPEMYDADLSIEVVANDWTLKVDNNWPIKIHNGTRFDIALAPNRCLRLSLLVYVNQPKDVTNGRWLRVSSSCVDPPEKLVTKSLYPWSEAGSCIAAGDSGDTTSVFLRDDNDLSTPPVYGRCKTSPTVYLPSNYIPQGRHLFVLIVDEDHENIHDAKPTTTDIDRPCSTETISSTPGITWPNNKCPGARTVKQIDFFSRAALPNVTLEIAQ